MEETFSNHMTTGIPGLDEILDGGLTAGKMYLLLGHPGAGKTTLSMQFIAEGIRKKERCLYITVGGGEDDLAALAHVGGIFLDPEFYSFYVVEISEEILEGPELKIFHKAESEPPVAMKDLLEEVKRVRPTRLVIDALSDLRYLTDELVSFRRLILALRREFQSGDSTVLITNNASETDGHLETACHGVIRLEQVVNEYGPIRRRLLVSKLRGRSYQTGWHDFRITRDGLCAFPTLRVGTQRPMDQKELLTSGNTELDLLFGGGIERGTTTAIIGASGTGKTTLMNLYVVAAAQRGERMVVYLFDETEMSYRARAEGLGLDVGDYIDKGLIILNEVDVAEFSVGEFTTMLLQEVEESGARSIAIDTLNGYLNAMPFEKHQIIQLHQLLIHLSHRGITMFLAVEQHGLFGDLGTEAKNLSYLADSLLLLRYFEYRGQIRRAISVVKKRRGKHETTIREFTMTRNGILIGEPLKEMQGVLTGIPTLGV